MIIYYIYACVYIIILIYYIIYIPFFASLLSNLLIIFIFLCYNLFMEVKKLVLKNFRNYSEREFGFNSGLNVLEGRNTVGKTNVVEAVYFCAFGKSPRTSKDKEVIKWGQENASIRLNVKKKYRNAQIDMLISQNGEKRIATDGAGISKMGELIGLINVVYFSPDEIKMIKEGPQERRRFLDVSLSQQNKSYFYALSKYTRILKNRNKLLKDGGSLKYIESSLPIWDQQLIDVGVDLIVKRLEFLNYLHPLVDDVHKSITNSNIGLNVEYETDIDLLDIRADFTKKLAENREKDIKFGYTTIGPHRDDVLIKSQGIDIRSYGSQGQQRTASLALKLAETVSIEEQTGETPILILDDVLSELDPTRRKALLEYSKNLQVLLTCTDFPEDKAVINNLIHLE